MEHASSIGRRSLIKRTATLAAMAPSSTLAFPAAAEEAIDGNQPTALADIPFSESAKLTIERRGQVALFGINRPYIQNRIDPETFQAMARAYDDYDHDPSLRAAVLYGHGNQFSRGTDVEGFKALASSGKPLIGR